MSENKSLQPLGLRPVVFMILTTCFGFRWITAAGGLGPSAVLFWLISALVFFVPLAFIVIELSLNYKDNGGIYLWVTDGLGERAGFYTAWFYWVNNVFYYPGLLTFIAANLAYLIGDHTLSDNPHFIMMVVIICFWCAVLFNILGIHITAKITTLSGLMNFRLGITLIIAGCYYVSYFHHSATDFSLESFLPHKGVFNSLSSITMLMLALAGVEAVPTISKSIRNPERNLTRAIIIGGAILVLLYMFGTVALNLILTPNELTKTTGLVSSIYALIAKLHWPLIIAKALIVSLMFVEFGGLNFWLITSSIMFFHCTEKGILPNWLQKLNHNYVPANALIFQGVMVTFICLFTQFLPTVNAVYTVLVLMSTIIYFLPYLFLSISYIKLRHNRVLQKQIMSIRVGKTMAILTFASIVAAICFAVIPTDDLKSTHEVFIYELELIAGPVLFILAGILIYRRKLVVKNLSLKK